MSVPWTEALSGTQLAAVGEQQSTVAVEPPGEGPGYWAGGPSAVWKDGIWWLSYRLRRPVTMGRGYANVVARSDDGVHFEPVVSVTSAQLECASLERPALVALPDGGWRLYVCCSTEATPHWWIEALTAPTVEGLADGRRDMVMAGDAATAWKDPVVTYNDGWHMWVCRHQTDVPGLDDRMDSWYATSTDGLTWDLQGTALEGRKGEWDQRGARITSVIADGSRYLAFYDGRATKEENWEERTGIAWGADPGRFTAEAGPVVLPGLDDVCFRYLSVAPGPDGSHRVFYEAGRADGAHYLRNEYVPRPRNASQSE